MSVWCWPPGGGGPTVVPTSGAGSGFRDPLWDPPLVANTDNEEFSTDVLASGGMTVRNFTAGTILTRAGAVDPTSYAAAGTFRSSLFGSTVLFQAPPDSQIYIYKTILNVGATYFWSASFGAIAGNNGSVPTNNDIILRLFLSPTAAGIPDIANLTYIGPETAAGARAIRTAVGGVTSTANISDAATGLCQPDCYGMRLGNTPHNPAGGVVVYWVYNRSGDVWTPGSRTDSNAGGNKDKVGFNYFAQSGGNGSAYNGGIAAFNFLRHLPLAGWFYG